jgi:hypothetical protein
MPGGGSWPEEDDGDDGFGLDYPDPDDFVHY